MTVFAGIDADPDERQEFLILSSVFGRHVVGRRTMASVTSTASRSLFGRGVGDV
jgi:hypothetical protein